MTWTRCTVPPRPSHDDVVVLRFSIDQPEGVVRPMAELLSPDEIDRAQRFAFDHLRRRHIAGRAALRIALSHATGIEPRELRFSYGLNGKPALDTDTPMRFNLSHAGGTALLAITEAGDVGVDIEEISHQRDHESMALRFFSDNERTEYQATATQDRCGAFFRCWTRKEAVIKATGDGLSMPLEEFDVSLATDNARLIRLRDQVDPEGWTLVDLRPDPPFAAAVAVRAPVARVRCWTWDPTAVLSQSDPQPAPGY